MTRCGGLSNITATPLSSATEIGAEAAAKESPKRNRTTPIRKYRECNEACIKGFIDQFMA
jgi:hypothetical protein